MSLVGHFSCGFCDFAREECGKAPDLRDGRAKLPVRRVHANVEWRARIREGEDGGLADLEFCILGGGAPRKSIVPATDFVLQTIRSERPDCAVLVGKADQMGVATGASQDAQLSQLQFIVGNKISSSDGVVSFERRPNVIKRIGSGASNHAAIVTSSTAS